MLPFIDFRPEVLFYASVALAAVFLITWLSTGRKRFSPKSGFATNSAEEKAKSLDLPKGWRTDTQRYQLERRAIFSKTWICISHLGRFVNPGDYVSYEYANFRFFLVLSRDGMVRAFHNVCRHRAFPVTKKESGTSTVLSCKYHGWSYDTKGKLMNAPQFNQVPGFDKSQNSLFEIQTHFDGHGFIHVNLNGRKDEAFDESLIAPNVASSVNINSRSKFVHSSEVTGKFNWKLAANDHRHLDTIQQAGENLFPKITFRPFFAIGSRPVQKSEFFPLTTVYSKPGSPLWYQVTFLPDSVQQTRLRCDVYVSDGSTSLSIQDSAKHQLEVHLKSIVGLYESQHANVTKGLPSQADHNYFLGRIIDLVTAHHEKERCEGKEVKPATIQQCRSAAFTKAEQLCQTLECASSNLSW